jgi:hypothetical protein
MRGVRFGVQGGLMTDTSAGEGAAQRRSFLERVKDALDDLTELMVVTSVGDLTVTVETANKSSETTVDKSTIKGSSLVTIVKVIDGDVTTVIAEKLLGNTELREIHAAQVAASLEVIPTHLRNLVELAKDLRDL